MRKRQSSSRQHLATKAGIPPARTTMQQLLHEPLLHFLLLGGVIFGAWTLLHPAGGNTRITVSAADVQRLRVQAMRQWGREPEAQALTALVEADIREQVLYREALANGLDRDDVVVRRRLVQKIDSLAQDQLNEPDDATLKAFWQQHSAGKTAAATLDLQQIFFSRALRGTKAITDARLALALLEQGADAGTGDPFLLPAQAEQQTQASLARDYGDGFAKQLIDLPADRWQGPLESSLGLHLVRIERRPAPAAGAFATVREQARQAYASQALSRAQEAAYRKMRARYQIDIAADALPAGATQ
jgi:peptidyl-prolyl cis-trans isomerase C